MIKIDGNPIGPFSWKRVRGLLDNGFTHTTPRVHMMNSVARSSLTVSWGIRQVIEGYDSIIKRSNFAMLIKLLESRADLDQSTFEVGHSYTTVDDGADADCAFDQLVFQVFEDDPYHINVECAELEPGTRITLVAKIIMAWDTIIEDVRIADENSVAEHERMFVVNRLGARAVRGLVSISESRDSDWKNIVYDWLHEFNNAALVDSFDTGCRVKIHYVIQAMYSSRILDKTVEAAVSKIMLESLIIFQRHGVQTESSLLKELGDSASFHPEYVAAALLLLDDYCLIGMILPPVGRRSLEDRNEAMRYSKQIETRCPGCGMGDIFVRR
jgi:hypothetical protein